MFLVDHSFNVKSKGRGRFPFVLADNWYQIQLSRSKADKMPMAYVQISSELLTLCGVDNSVSSLNNVISVLAGKVVFPTISRADLCVDFVTDLDLEAIPQSHWITRATRHARFYDQGQFSGFTFGQGGPISCRLYDKTLEIKKSQKTYLFELWKEQGWDGESAVWRLEFQYQRDLLKEASIHSLPELIQYLNALWTYSANQWLQLKQPQTDSNTTRWPVYPEWQALLKAEFNDHSREAVQRIRKDTSPSDRSLFVNGLGGITSFMAREGLQTIDEALERYLVKAHEYHRLESQRTGKTLPTYVREKVELKRTRYAARAATESHRASYAAHEATRSGDSSDGGSHD